MSEATQSAIADRAADAAIVYGANAGKYGGPAVVLAAGLDLNTWLAIFGAVVTLAGFLIALWGAWHKSQVAKRELYIKQAADDRARLETEHRMEIRERDYLLRKAAMERIENPARAFDFEDRIPDDLQQAFRNSDVLGLVDDLR
jgi:hypothetical protein